MAHRSALRKAAPTASADLQEWVGWVRYKGIVTALDDRLEFTGFLEPVEGLYDGNVSEFEGKPIAADVLWSDIRSVTITGESVGHHSLVFHLQNGPDDPWHEIAFIRITDFLKPGRGPWIDFLNGKGIAITEARR